MFEAKNGLSRNKAGEEICERCHQSWDSFKKIIQGKTRATRELLYKFCIGMELTIEQANELFSLSNEGVLTDDNIGDYIFIRALGHDDINTFINQYEEFVGKKIEMRNP